MASDSTVSPDTEGRCRTCQIVWTWADGPKLTDAKCATCGGRLSRVVKPLASDTQYSAAPHVMVGEFWQA